MFVASNTHIFKVTFLYVIPITMIPYQLVCRARNVAHPADLKLCM